MLVTVALAALLVSACVAERASTPSASNATPGPSGTPPLSSLPPGLGAPSGPPKSPTDQSPEWIAGRITRGGSGPCYGLETDDGVEYALYSADGVTLQEGAIVRVRVEPLLLRIDCGPGQPVHVLELEPVG